MGGVEEKSRDMQASRALEQLIKKYGVPQCGRNRAAFISKNYVLKFSLNDDGQQNNYFESWFKSENTARGRSLMIKGFLCLIQEKLSISNSLASGQPLPHLVKSIDCEQVGYDAKAILKTYNFAESNLYNKKNKI